ncbi:ABC transporter substrate-binding protein [Paraburkholderia sp. JHI2823]|uniref:ABC transporter substrate-binding protein n=1 Tax=Paraburkholderia sp. JHI2823 TaxID=3112960 RepID=UPI0031738651
MTLHRIPVRAALRLALLPLLASALLTSNTAVAKDVTFVTDFNVNGRHAYYYVALEKGYYKQEGLDVTIVRGGGSADAIRKVAAGQAQIGFADAGSLVLARANDNVPVKLVSVVYQQPPHAIFTTDGSGIRTPKDLMGRSVADSATSSVMLMFGAYAKASGIDKDKVHFVIADGSALPAMLATGRVDAICQYSVGEPLLEKVVAPKKLVRLAYKDAGLDFYSNGIIASDDMIKNDPETIRKFVTATLKGMRDAFANPVEAGEILHREQRQVDADIGTGETREVAELAQFPNGPLGSISEAKMQKTVDIVSSAYKLKRPVTAQEMFAPGFVPH